MARSSPFVGAALALIAGGHLVAQSANISITIVTPVEGAMSASPLVVTYSVMSIFQVASVTGVVGSRTMNGAGQVDLTGLAEGPQTLVLTATDVFGNTATASRGFVYQVPVPDNPPVISVVEPHGPDDVVRGRVHVRAFCADDTAAGCSGFDVTLYRTQAEPGPKLQANGATIDGDFSLDGFGPGMYRLLFAARDSSNQLTTVASDFLFEPGPALEEVTRVDGEILDADASRILYRDDRPTPSVVKVRSRATGVDTVVGGDASWRASGGRLLPNGALLVTEGTALRVREWRNGALVDRGDLTRRLVGATLLTARDAVNVAGNHAAWFGADGLIRQLRIDTGVVRTLPFPIDPISGLDLNAAGQLVYIGGIPTSVQLDTGGVATPLTPTFSNVGPRFAGTAVTYWHQAPQTWELHLVDVVNDTALFTTVRPPSSSGFDARDGSMAYTGDSADVYLRNPAGGISQLTFFAHPPGAANDIPLALGSNGGHIVQRGAGPDIWLAHLGQPSVYLTRRDYTFVASAAPHSRPARVLEISSVWHVAIGGSLFVVKDPLAPDTDGDGLPDAWEVRYGLDPSVASGANGASGDPDADGLTNLQEYQQQSHPRATFTRYLAEGATGAFFSTRLALFNPRADARDVLLRFLKSDGTTVTQSLTLSPSSRRDIDVAAVPGMSAAEFATVLESDGEVVMDRTMAWNETGYGSHAERALAAPSQTWYLAEGATFGAFDLFYLLQNSGVAPAEVDITFLRPSGVPIVRHYTLPAASRTTVWVDQLAGLESTDVSASIASDHPIIVERAMYSSDGTTLFRAGHESAGVPAPSEDWFLAEGATGPYFDMFVLLANPGTSEAHADVSYLFPDGSTLVRSQVVAPQSRATIWVDLEDARLADAAVSTAVHADVPIVVERTMWWPGSASTWVEAHNSPGSTVTSTRWAFAEADSSPGTSTYVLVANTSATAGVVRVTVVLENGTLQTGTYPLPAKSRTNVPLSAGERASVVVEVERGTTPVALVAERASYQDRATVRWEAGSAALGTPLLP